MLPDSLLPPLLRHQWTGDKDDEDPGGGGGARVGKGLLMMLGRSLWVGTAGGERGDEQTVEEMRGAVMKLCDSLVKREVLNVSPIEWNGKFGEEEEWALSRAGFLVDQYQVDHW